MMGKFFNLLVLCFVLIISSSSLSFATVFAGNSELEFTEQDATFLQKIGVVASSEKADSKDPKPNLLVSFSSSMIPDYEDVGVELLLVDSNNEVLLVIEAPFPNEQHSIHYTVSLGYSLIVSVAAPLSRDTKYSKVTFSNICREGS